MQAGIRCAATDKIEPGPILSPVVQSRGTVAPAGAQRKEAHMEFSDVIKSRYSCKKYDSARQVTPEQLTAILEAGRVAPTAKNLQEQHVYVLQSDADLALIDELIAMSEFFDIRLADYDLAIDYRIKSEESIVHKYERYYPDHQTRKVFNDILGFRN